MDGSGALASASGSAEAAIELSPCWASVAPSASGSDCVAASSEAHRRCNGKTVFLCIFVRRIGCVRLLRERDLIDIEVEGEEESTPYAARRRHSLYRKVSGVQPLHFRRCLHDEWL